MDRISLQDRARQVLTALREQRTDAALHAARVLLADYPDDESALSLCASCEQQAGNHDVAVVLFARLTQAHSRTWQYWNNLGNAQRALGQVEHARLAFERALELNPAAPRLRANLGLLLLNAGDPAQAATHLRAASAAPDAEPGMRIWAAVAVHAAGDAVTAEELVRGWEHWPRDSDEAWLELGWLLLELGHFDDAEHVFASAFSGVAARIRAKARHALLLERINQPDAAERLLADLPDPDRVAATEARQELLHARGMLAARRKDWPAARQALQDALAIAGNTRGRRAMYFALARACDRLDDVDAALDALHQAHGLRAATRAQDALHERWLPVLTTGLPAAQDVQRWRLAAVPVEQSPVFVVGFPRSGTTLLEQMLAAHPDFASIDERPLVLSAIRRMQAQGLAYPQGLGALRAEQIEDLRAGYWRAADALATRAHGQRLVDKNPLNMLALPMILRLFPLARVIICRRHPCDVILSCYMQPFADPEVAEMSASPASLARAYAAFDAQFREQAALLGATPFELRYEDLVTHPQAALQGLGNCLGVQDTTAMAHFASGAQRRGYISTPSYAQVVESLRADSIGRWRRYARVFAPLLPTLAESIRQAGYTTD